MGMSKVPSVPLHLRQFMAYAQTVGDDGWTLVRCQMIRTLGSIRDTGVGACPFNKRHSLAYQRGHCFSVDKFAQVFKFKLRFALS